MTKASKPKTKMYDGARTWSCFKGCEFDCTYCVPSFQMQAKRQRKNCGLCYEYQPHEHPERLAPAKIPACKIVFVAGNGDLAFADVAYIKRIIHAIKMKNASGGKDRIYYLQSKAPAFLEQHLLSLPMNVRLVTTLETNRGGEFYSAISDAPPPPIRAEAFRRLRWPHKVVTIEPLVDFDEHLFLQMLIDIGPELIWIGFNSRPKQVDLPEPSAGKVERLIHGLRAAGIEIRAKDLRGLEID